MRTRLVLSAAALTAVAAAFPLAGVASAQPGAADRDCRDFASQAAAQSALRSHSGDPMRLDPDHDGIACEDYFKTGDNAVVPAPAPAPRVPAPAPAAPAAQTVLDRDPSPRVVLPPPGTPADAAIKTVPEHQILVKPAGAADTGDGSSAPGDTVPLALLAGGLGVVTLGAAYRSHRSR